MGLARVKWMDKNTYMLRMNVERALGISWAAKMSDYKERGSVRRKEGRINVVRRIKQLRMQVGRCEMESVMEQQKRQ